MQQTFSNNSVDLTYLPQIETLTPQPLAPSYARINLLILIAVLCSVLSIGTFLYYQTIFKLPGEFISILPAIMLAVVILAGPLCWVTFQADKQKYYALRELDVHFSSGLFFKKMVSQPISRIQHIELKRGPIERKAGLASLQVFSAGGAMHTFEIPGLPFANAQQLRQIILKHKSVLTHG